ncbi:MAG: YtxH domain-containing protein [Chloroflexi bacterium]|nr:YtxH domain-containing protein [Chloroflexota bacterium]
MSANNTGNFVLGFVVGGLIGAGIALLNAPRSGDETRQMIARKGQEFSEQAQAEISRMRAEGERTLDDIRARADDVLADAQDRIGDARQQVSPN